LKPEAATADDSPEMHRSLTSVALVVALAIAAQADSWLVVPLAVVIVFRAAAALVDRRYRAAR
jgi:hypothetical protein